MSTGFTASVGGVILMMAPSTPAASVFSRLSTAAPHVPDGATPVPETLPMLTGSEPTWTNSAAGTDDRGTLSEAAAGGATAVGAYPSSVFGGSPTHRPSASMAAGSGLTLRSFWSPGSSTPLRSPGGAAQAWAGIRVATSTTERVMPVRPARRARAARAFLFPGRRKFAENGDMRTPHDLPPRQWHTAYRKLTMNH